MKILLFTLILFFSADTVCDGGTLPNPEEVRLNLVLRNIGHEVYRIQKDTVSRLEPIQTYGENRFMINVGVRVSYDTLIQLADSILLSHGIKDKYDVALLDCETNNVLLGYTHESLERDNVACRKREMGDECHNILIHFHSDKPTNYTWLYGIFGIIILLIFGLIYSFWKNKETADLPDWDETNQSLSYLNKTIEFTHRENIIFKLLYEAKGGVVTRETIEEKAWQNTGLFKSRTLDVTISKIRKKISVLPNWEIQAVHGIGYKLLMDD